MRGQTPPGDSCTFALRADDARVDDRQHCLMPLLGFVATSWSVQPDAILLAGEGLRLPMLFSRQAGGRFEGRTAVGATLWIERGAP